MDESVENIEDKLMYAGGSLPDKAYYTIVSKMLAKDDMLLRLGKVSLSELGCLDFLSWVQNGFMTKWTGAKDKRLESLIQTHLEGRLAHAGDRGKWFETLDVKMQMMKGKR